MQVTAVRLQMLTGATGKIKAYASITLDGEFVVHDLRVVAGANGLFVAMPSQKGQDGEYRDLAHPVTPGAREVIQKAVLAAFQEQNGAE